MKYVSIIEMQNPLTGLEYFYDIPSSLGGAIYLNTGLNNMCISQYITSITYYNIDLKETITISDDIIDHFDYRFSSFQKTNFIVLNSTKKHESGNKDEINSKRLKNNRAERS